MNNDNIYDGVGIINYNRFQIPLKQVRGMVITIKSKEHPDNEEKYLFLKGFILTFDLSSFVKIG